MAGYYPFYNALDIILSEKLARTFEAKYPGIAVRVERSGAAVERSASIPQIGWRSLPSTIPVGGMGVERCSDPAGWVHSRRVRGRWTCPQR